MLRIPVVLLLTLLVSVASPAAEDPVVQLEKLDAKVQGLKSSLLQLSAEISRVEQQIYPEQSRITLFINLANLPRLKLESASVHIDGKLVESHLYTEAESKAMTNGGVQKLYSGYLVSGEHDITLNMSALSDDGARLKLSADTAFNKDKRAVLLEAGLRQDDNSRVSIELKEH